MTRVRRTHAFAHRGLVFAILVAAVPARAADPVATTNPTVPTGVVSPWFLRLGAAGVLFDSSASIKLAGAPVPGASAKAADNLTAMFEFGYYLNPNLSLQFTGGFPPTTTLTGKGTIAPLGTLGKATYGPAAISASYHFTDFGAFKPYVGAGALYAIVFSTRDGAVTGLKVDGAPGALVQAGFDYALDKNWSIFVDAKKLFLSVDARGTALGAPVTAHIRLDPTIVSTGIAYRW
jgi:outer membrane protein